MLDSLDVKPDADLSSSLSKTLSEIFIQTGE
jgi:hypothetical protein